MQATLSKLSWIVAGMSLLLAGCESPRGDSRSGRERRACIQLDQEDLGSLAEISVGTTTVSLSGWTMKDGQEDLIGFRFTTPGFVQYAVQAGNETFQGSASEWVNPQAHAISNITFCEVPPPTEQQRLSEATPRRHFG